MSFEGLQVKPLTFTFDTIAADISQAIRVPSNIKIVSAHAVSVAGVAASDINYAIVTITNKGAAGSGSTVVAECDTRAAHEGALTANVAETMNLNATAANLNVAAGEVLTALVDIGGTTAGDLTLVLGYTFR